MRIAVVHDYFTQLGGAERVAEALAQMFPSATLFAIVADAKRLPAVLKHRQIQTSWMQHLPAMKKLFRHYVLLYSHAVESLDLSGFDLVISSSSGFAKGVRTDPKAVHVCYCHSPMRWAWRYDDYAAREKFGFPMRHVLPAVAGHLRRWDLKASQRPDQFVVNSKVVAARVHEAYGRRSIVIPPPVDVSRFAISEQQDDYYLVLSRLVAYKRIDVAIEACRELKRKLIIIGTGTDRARLEGLAGPDVEFLGRVPEDVVGFYASRCRALLLPGEEDFGLVPLEVNAAGRPVIAYNGGGATETIIDGLNGTFFKESTAASLTIAMLDFEKRTWDARLIRAHAEQFRTEVFERRMLQLLSSLNKLPGKAPFFDHEKSAAAVA